MRRPLKWWRLSDNGLAILLSVLLLAGLISLAVGIVSRSRDAVAGGLFIPLFLIPVGYLREKLPKWINSRLERMERGGEHEEKS
jgi:hypothetical protein